MTGFELGISDVMSNYATTTTAICFIQTSWSSLDKEHCHITSISFILILERRSFDSKVIY